MYRFERILRDCMRLKKKRRERFVRQPAPDSFEGAVEEMEQIGGLVGAMEYDGHLDVVALDEFESRLRGAIRAAVADTDVVARTYNDLAPRLLHARKLDNRRDMTVARGLLALTQLAVEERIAVAVAAELSVAARWDHMTFPDSLDLGDRAYLREKALRQYPANTDLTESDGVPQAMAARTTSVRSVPLTVVNENLGNERLRETLENIPEDVTYNVGYQVTTSVELTIARNSAAAASLRAAEAEAEAAVLRAKVNQFEVDLAAARTEAMEIRKKLRGETERAERAETRIRRSEDVWRR